MCKNIFIETIDGKEFEYELCDYYIKDGYLTVYREKDFYENYYRKGLPALNANFKIEQVKMYCIVG